MGLFAWIDQIEIKHIVYLGVMSASLFIVGFIGKYYIVGLLEPTGNAAIILHFFHEGIIWFGVTFLVFSLLSLFILMEVS